jgi:cbb3-type cytochrome oxidase cytochrome c subunit
MKRLLFVLGAVLVAMLVALAWEAENPEWMAYQRGFFAAGAAQARSDTAREWYREQRIGIREIRVDALRRVDRCTTCHLGVDDPNFVGAPEPFRTHSPLLASHPPEKYGCTGCHNGRGRAVTTLDAHGDSEEAPSHLWRGVYLQTACYLCHGEKTPSIGSELALNAVKGQALPGESVAAVLEGRKAINQLRCLRCHQIRGEGESEGPELSAVGSRRDWVEIFAHLLNPQAMSPGSTMPDFPLTRAQAEAITVYLLTLQGPAREVYDARYLARGEGGSLERSRGQGDEGTRRQGDCHLVSSSPCLPLDDRSTPEVAPFRYDGRTLFRGLGCTYCHRVGTAGGEVGPALTHIGRVRDVDWLRRWLRDPAAVLPGGTMPRLYLNEAQVEALADYLATLR